MATIAEQLTSLANTKTAIKDAIVAKGVQVSDDTPFSGYATKIGEISGGGTATKFGASVDTWIGDVVDGVLQKSTVQTALNFAGVTEFATSGLLQYKFYKCTGITSVDLSSLTTISSHGLAYAFYDCTGITNVDLSSLQTVDSYGMSYMLYGCKSITSVDLSSLQTVASYGLQYTFCKCTGITSVDLSSLTTVASYGMVYAFYGCTGLQTISFPSLTNVQTESFESASYNAAFYNCTALTEIHFRADMQATIEAMAGYASKWGATNATIYFDL